MMRCLLARLIILVAILPAIAYGEQPKPNVAPATARISFVDEHGVEHRLAESDLAKLPRATVKVAERNGKPAQYEGVPLSALLTSQGVKLGKALRGPRIAEYLLFEASDGYRVVLSIAETDPETSGKTILLADKKDGSPLSAKEGPWRLIVPDDKRPVRWIRMVQRITLKSAAADSQPK